MSFNFIHENKILVKISRFIDIYISGTITSLDFHKGFMFSTSEDGKLCLWKAFTWECLRTFKGHKYVHV